MNCSVASNIEEHILQQPWNCGVCTVTVCLCTGSCICGLFYDSVGWKTRPKEVLGGYTMVRHESRRERTPALRS